MGEQENTRRIGKSKDDRFRNRINAFLLSVILIATGIVAWSVNRPISLYALVVGLSGFFLALGFLTRGHAFATCINSRNLVSLSQFQTLFWTVIVLAVYLAIVFARLKAGEPEPLKVTIQWELLALLGISSTSLILSPMAALPKKDKEPANEEKTMAKLASATDLDVGELKQSREGLLYGNPDIKDATLLDMVQGDEVGNTTHIDMPKLQMLLFTLIAGSTYLMVSAQGLSKPDGVTLEALPALSQGFLTLLGISHATYLAGKTITNSPTT